MKHKMSIQKAKSLLPQFQAALQEKHYTIRTINEICINVKTYLRSITDRYDYVTEKNLKDYLQERKLHTNGKRINCIQNACRKYFNFRLFAESCG